MTRRPRPARRPSLERLEPRDLLSTIPGERSALASPKVHVREAERDATHQAILNVIAGRHEHAATPHAHNSTRDWLTLTEAGSGTGTRRHTGAGGSPFFGRSGSEAALWVGSGGVRSNGRGAISPLRLGPPTPVAPVAVAPASNPAGGAHGVRAADGPDDGSVTVSANQISGPEDTNLGDDLGSFQGTEGDNYSIWIDYGDGYQSGGSYSDNGTGEFEISGGDSYPEAGTYTVVITVEDLSNNAVGIAQTTATISDPPLTMTGTSPVVAVEGQGFSGQLATFYNADEQDDLAGLSASIDWGDGTITTVSGSDGGISAIDYNGDFAVNGSHTYAEEGAYQLIIQIFDDGGSSTSTGDPATVSDAPLTMNGGGINTTEGLSLTGPVATFTDANPGAPLSDFAATIIWGDGQTTTGTVIHDPYVPDQFDVLGYDPTTGMGHAYDEEGTYTGSVEVDDVGGSVAVAGISASVADAPLTAMAGTPPPESATGGSTGDVVLATFTDDDPNGMVGDYTATIDWGDGTDTTSGIIAAGTDPGTFTVTGSHTYDAPASSPIVVTVQDVGGSQDSVTLAMANTPSLDLDIAGLDENGEDYPGGLVVKNADGNNAPRQQITLNLVNPVANMGGVVTLDGGGKLTVYNAAADGNQVNTVSIATLANGPVTLYVQGASESQSMRDAKLTASSAGVNPDSVLFTVLWVDTPMIKLGRNDTVTTGNSARAAYMNLTKANTDKLGPQLYNPLAQGDPPYLGWGFEMRAYVHPSNFKYDGVDLELSKVVQLRRYDGNTLDEFDQRDFGDIPSGQDLDDDNLRDDNPADSNGWIYSLDAPSIVISGDNVPFNSINRVRVNFRAFAMVTLGRQVVRASPIQNFYVRSSAIQTTNPNGNNWVVMNPPDVPGDNNASTGQTPVSWNLQ